jgi:IMP and pyridine-specific 5'-nucleotidase
MFFTPLHLEKAFQFQDRKRFISSRRFVAPSFNDIRLILNTAQMMGLVSGGSIELITFDGDVTLYDDGQSLTDDNPVISRILDLLHQGVRVGIVTAAGYTDAARYQGRLQGLLDAIYRSTTLPDLHKRNLVVIGGESSYLFKFDASTEHLLTHVPREEWVLKDMAQWTQDDITKLLNEAEKALRDCVRYMQLDAVVLRKERAVGIIPKQAGGKFAREQLEETVLVTQKILEMSDVGQRLPFCAFNGMFRFMSLALDIELISTHRWQ